MFESNFLGTLMSRMLKRQNRYSQAAEYVVRVRHPLKIHLDEETPSYLLESQGMKNTAILMYPQENLGFEGGLSTALCEQGSASLSLETPPASLCHSPDLTLDIPPDAVVS